jgi:hypothetical protein
MYCFLDSRNTTSTRKPGDRPITPLAKLPRRAGVLNSRVPNSRVPFLLPCKHSGESVEEL